MKIIFNMNLCVGGFSNSKINLTLLTILTPFLIGCGGGGGSTPTSNTISGSATKGPMVGAVIEVRRVDTNTLLGTTSTSSDGKYTVDIGEYSGAVKVNSTGGVYTDEIDGLEKNASAITIRAFSVVNPTLGFSVNITPFTDISSKKLEALTTIDENTIIEENKKVALSFMGEEFDITKVTPKIRLN